MNRDFITKMDLHNSHIKSNRQNSQGRQNCKSEQGCQIKGSKSAGTVARLSAVIALLLTAIGLLTGCAQQTGANDTSRERIIVGIDKFEPYTYLDLNGEYRGIDIELARDAFARMGYEPVFNFIEWSEKNEYLADGTIDCIWSCFSMTGREDKYQWAGPYMYSRQVIAVRADSDIYTLTDLAGRRVGVQATTKAESLFLGTSESLLPEAGQINTFSTADDMFGALRKGYVDAIAGHEALLKRMLSDDTGSYRILDESPYISQLGVAFQKGTHIEPAQELTRVLEDMNQDGTMDRIVSSYGLDPDKVIGGRRDSGN